MTKKQIKQAYRDAANRLRSSNNEEIQVDDKAPVSIGDEPGAYVQCWVWVRDSDAGLANDADESTT